jgi:hypothetical protein
MKKTAYCLGINDYDASGAYGKGSNLNGCIEDTKTMKGIFLKLGFDVITLTDAQCTRERVAQIFSEFNRSSEPGDIMALTFSMHGTYKNEDGERHTGLCLWDGVLWDSDYRSLLAAVKKNRGIIHIPDSCYSQDNWKSVMPKGPNRLRLKYLPTEKVLNQGQQFTYKYAKKLAIQCNVITITSSTDMQPSYDMGATGGHFTISFAKAVASRSTIANYFDIYNKTIRIMAESSLPQNPIFRTVNGNIWKWTYRCFGE